MRFSREIRNLFVEMIIIYFGNIYSEGPYNVVEFLSLNFVVMGPINWAVQHSRERERRRVCEFYFWFGQIVTFFFSSYILNYFYLFFEIVNLSRDNTFISFQSLLGFILKPSTLKRNWSIREKSK